MDLGPLLDAHLPADDREAGHLSEMAELWAAQGDRATRRTSYTPGHFTSSGMVLSPDRSAVALIHHTKLGIWVQPGGHFEDADTDPDQAARREVAEEVGLTDLLSLGLLDTDIHAIPARRDEPAHRHFDLRLGFVATGGQLVAGDGTTDARWVRFGDLHAHQPDAGLRRAVGKLQQLA